MLLNSIKSRRVDWIIGLLLALSATGASAGALDSPAAPTNATSAMFTLTDLYNRLIAGTAGVKRFGVFVEPTANPIAGTGYTLDQIMAVMPTVDDATGAGVADVLAGKTFWGLTSGAWGLKTGTMAVTAGANVTGTNGALTFNIPNGFYSGGKTATAADANLTAGNIITGKTIFGVNGSAVVATGDATDADVLALTTYSSTSGASTGTMPNNAAVTITPATVAQTISAGYHNGSGTVKGDANLTAGNIKKDVVIFGVTGTSAPCTCSGSPTSTRWCDNGNGTVTDLLGSTVNDKVQGRCLVWLKDAGWGGKKAWRVDEIDNYDDAHTRAGALSATSLGSKPFNLNDGSVTGDWRLPTLTELRVLTTGDQKVRYATPGPFTDVKSDYYWSSSTFCVDESLDMGGNNEACLVPLDKDYRPGFNGVDKSKTHYVWPVRGGQ